MRDLRLAMIHRETIVRKFKAVAPTLTERGRRLWAGAEAESLGRGGIALVAGATGMAISTVQKGRNEIRAGIPVENLVKDRRRGAGRPRLEKSNPRLIEELEKLVSPATRGDPESALRWTIKSTRALALELTQAGHRVSPQKVGELLRAAGYSLQGTSRVKEGQRHPDRNAQFEHIQSRADDFLNREQPVISVDTKKKELVGEFGRAGREWQPQGKPIKVNTYEFADADVPKAIPYGVYDVGSNTGFVNVGVDHDTSKFAVESIRKWWLLRGRDRYPSGTELFITADSGGSNSAASHVWKVELQKLADETGLTIEVSHFPPGTSKWNKIEHRLFSFITLNWRGRPLVSYETIVALISNTKTSKGLTVEAHLDSNTYLPAGRVPKHVMAHVALDRGPFHGEWNYKLRPRSNDEIETARRARNRRDTKRDSWRTLIEEQIASGLNSNQFCKSRGLNYAPFIAARRREKGLLAPNVSAGIRKSLKLIQSIAPADE